MEIRYAQHSHSPNGLIFRVPFYYILCGEMFTLASASINKNPAAKTDHHHRHRRRRLRRRCKWIYREDAIGISMKVNVSEQRYHFSRSSNHFDWNWKLIFPPLFDRKIHAQTCQSTESACRPSLALPPIPFFQFFCNSNWFIFGTLYQYYIYFSI